MNRHILFRHYWWLALIATISGVVLISTVGGNDRIPWTGSLIAAALGFCYFVQQQKLAEISLFKDLFTEFNIRYNAMNDRLLEISGKPDASSLADKQFIVDYLNLCAEEFLFYKEGYIHRDVWRSWCRGMLWYMTQEPFASIWTEEYQTGSYYGLSMEEIQKGAA